MVLISSRLSVVSEGGPDVGPSDGRFESVTTFFQAHAKAGYREKSSYIKKSHNVFYMHCNNLAHVKSVYATCSDFYTTFYHVF